MTQTTTAAEIAETFSVEDLEQALASKKIQQGLDKLKSIVNSTDPAHKPLQEVLLKKVKVWERKNAPKRAYTGKPRGRKPGTKKTASETAPTA